MLALGPGTVNSCTSRIVACPDASPAVCAMLSLVDVALLALSCMYCSRICCTRMASPFHEAVGETAFLEELLDPDRGMAAAQMEEVPVHIDFRKGIW